MMETKMPTKGCLSQGLPHGVHSPMESKCLIVTE